MAKVLFITDTLGAGGAERQLALLARHLPPEWRKSIWSMGDGAYATVLRNWHVPVEIHQRSRHNDVRPLFSLWSTIVGWRPDLVHSWGWMTSAFAAPLCRVFHIPFVDGSLRIGWAPREHYYRARIAFRLADRVIANSFAGLKACNIPSGKGRVIYNGFDPERLPLTRCTNRSQFPFRVVMAARMTPVKDFRTFINVARFASNDGQDRKWHFSAIGDGIQKAELLEHASNLIRNGIMSFPDARLEVLPYINLAHAGVLLTNPNLGQEGCSNTIMEYMFCGLPVICSNTGGNRELVINGETGFIIPSNDENAIVEKLEFLRSNPEIAQKMGEAGRQRALSEFSVEKMVNNTIKVYEEALTNASYR